MEGGGHSGHDLLYPAPFRKDRGALLKREKKSQVQNVKVWTLGGLNLDVEPHLAAGRFSGDLVLNRLGAMGCGPVD